MAIWLAFEDDEQREHHMKWEGHETIDSAKIELDYIFNAILAGGNKFPNTYVYEADEPLYGNEEEVFNLGEMDKVFSDIDRINS